MSLPQLYTFLCEALLCVIFSAFLALFFKYMLFT
jgi:hypothetical protein